MRWSSLSAPRSCGMRIGFAAAGDEDLLVLLGEADDRQVVQAERVAVP